MEGRDLKWFMRNIKGVSIRNLCRGLDIPQTLLSPQIEILGDFETVTPKILLVSPVLTSTCNPTWTTTALRALSSLTLLSCIDYRVFRIIVYDANENNTRGKGRQPIAYFDVDMQRIVRLGDLNFSSPEISSLPINSVVFHAEGSVLFTTEAVYQRIKMTGAIVQQKLLSVQPTYDDTDYQLLDAKLNSIRQSMLQSNMILGQKKNDVNMLYEKADRSRRTVDKFTKKMELMKLREEVEMEEKMALEEERLEKLEFEMLRGTRDLRPNLEICDTLIRNIGELNESILNQKDELMKLQFMFEVRQTRILTDLKEIYPIDKLGADFTIRGLEFNEFNTGPRDDEVVSTAMGYIVHLLQLISKYIECPLRYHLLFYASRSMIRDPVGQPGSVGQASSASSASPLSGVTLPLYRRGAEKERYDLAIQWLKVDLEQIFAFSKFPYRARDPILCNLYYYFRPDANDSLA